MRKLPDKFFARKTNLVAKDLLGQYLVRKINNKEIICRITEVESYIGPKDKASHASKGRTSRTEIMFGPAGRFYVYLIYGMYYCLNLITEDKDFPAAILIRSVEPISNLEIIKKNRKINNNIAAKNILKNLTNGPGKLCQALNITKEFNGKKFNQDLYIADSGEKIPKNKIISAKRLNINYAQEYKEKLWRFYIK